MNDAVETLVVDLLEWIGECGRPYSEVLDAWRTSCPRLPIWEEANDRGLVVRDQLDSGGTLVRLSPKGVALLAQRGRRHHLQKA
jgi:hypothetical protein